MNNVPIFIGGQMKSGTTMLRMLLSKHSNIFSGLETYWFTDDISKKYMIPDNRSVLKLKEFYNLTDNEIKLIILQTNKNSKPFVNNFFNHLLKKSNKNRWLEKTPDNIKYLKLINDNWNSYKFIHVLRDFRDIYASWKVSKKHDIKYYIKQVKSCYDPNLDILGKKTDTYFEVKYENIINDCRKQIKRILFYLEENFQANCLELDLENSKKEFEKVYKVSGKKSITLKSTQEPINKKKINHYKSILTKDEISYIEKELEIYFKIFDYKMS